MELYLRRIIIIIEITIEKDYIRFIIFKITLAQNLISNLSQNLLSRKNKALKFALQNYVQFTNTFKVVY